LVRAQQLSIRHFDVSDGLAHSHVVAMHQDAKGFLWLATWEGLSRFDGYGFTNYGTRDGLGDPIINAIAEDQQNRLWVATNAGGVARLIDDPQASPSVQGEPAPSVRQKFISFPIGDSPASNIVNGLLFDSQNNLWCATDGGIYKATAGQGGDLKFEVIVPDQAGAEIAFADSQGRLWFGTKNNLIEIVRDQIIEYGADDEVGRYPVVRIIEDGQGRLNVANEREIFQFISSPDGKSRGRWKKWPLNFKPDQGINTILSDSAGALWIGTWNGLIKYHDGKQTLYTSAQGLSDSGILSFVEDRDGNLWIGTEGGGVCKLSSELIISFTRTEGLPNQNVRKVIEDMQGNIFGSIQNGGLVRIVEEKAVPLRDSQVFPFSNFNERILQDQHGDWWIGTDSGLFRFEGPELQLRRGQKFSSANGVAETSITTGLWQDANGKIWVSPKGDGLCCFDQTEKGRLACKHIPSSALAAFAPGVMQMIGDRSGSIWLGGHWLLGRLISGRVVMLEPTDGLPEANPRDFFSDSRGWLWIGLRYKGVSMTKDPTAEAPKFFNYSTADGLASDAVWAIAEDDFGRMYFGTGKGLDQLDLTTGRIRHFNTDDGLASDVINYCLKDKRGNIWVATTLGLSKYNPRAERKIDQPAPIYLSRVQIAGDDLPLPETGARSAPNVELPASRNNLLIEYVALSFEGEHRLRYQYKLEGVDSDWSLPTESRSINYAHLAAGSYQFLARSINQEGIVSDAAAFGFRILPPIWQRWWFLTLAAVVVALVIYAAHRQRVARLVELERVRTRIATDLHDDIGANLSLIAMLSEVARGNLQRDDLRMKEWFSTIAATSRDTVDAMSDIVWAVNPKRDHLRDLTQRMRRFAEDIFGARGVELEFRTPEAGRDLKVGADLRREVFLIFKESINNIVRHSGCTSADVEMHIEHGWLVLQMSDNGRGLDLTHTGEGNGLASMRLRAKRLGGRLDVSSTNGHGRHGTSVTLRVPLDHRGEPLAPAASDS
jgi:ligand-binding sensor domain-containing protein/signal transduction histidine kinase